METDEVTMGTRAPRCPGASVSSGMPHILVKMASRDLFMRKSKIVPICVAIQGALPWMGHCVSPQMRPWNGSTVACPRCAKEGE